LGHSDHRCETEDAEQNGERAERGDNSHG
jgi:hypothetical protein